MMDFKLSDEFVSTYTDKKIPWGYEDGAGNALGEISALRTYSRTKENGSKETWQEVCRRVIEGMFTIQKRHCKQNHIEWKNDKAQRTAKDAYDRLFKMKWLPAGRGLWAMGTPIVMDDNNSAPLQSCAFISTEESVVDAMTFLFDASMLGVGVGFDGDGAGKFLVTKPESKTRTYTIADSREGWVDSLKHLMNAYFDPERTTNPNFDYSLIRPYGAPIKRFGGVASGPGPLKKMHEKIKAILDNRVGQNISMQDICDIGNIIGACVVAGNVRRSAEIFFVDRNSPDFNDFLELKDYTKNPDRAEFGWMSNNSVRVNVGDDLSPFMKGIMDNGEPGVVWMDTTRKFGRLSDLADYKDARVKGYNPCVEQPLESGETCNLVETFINNCEDQDDFIKTLKVAYLYGKTVTLLPTKWEKTNTIMQRNRRIGLSASGVADYVDTNGMATLRKNLDDGFKYILKKDVQYSEWLCVRESIRHTTMKPSGCRPADGLLTTSQGIFTLGEVTSNHPRHKEWEDVPEGRLTSVQGDSVTKTYLNGQSEVWKVSLSHNMEVESTPNHQWYVKGKRTRSNPSGWDPKFVAGWYRTDSLEPDHVLDISPGVYASITESRLNTHISDLYCNVVTRKVPSSMSPELAWVLGYMWGDGTMDPKSSRIRFSDQGEGNLRKVKSILEDQFGYGGNLYRASQGRDAYSLELRSSEIFKFFSLNGFWKYTDDGGIADIPLVVRTSSHESVLAFLAGLTDADGCVHSVSNGTGKSITIATADGRFAKHIQNVALTVGVSLGRSHNTQGENLQGTKSMWLLSTNTGSVEERFQKYVTHSTKAANSLPSLEWVPLKENRRKFILGKVKSVGFDRYDDTYDVEVDSSHWYYAGAVKSHNTISLVAGSSPGTHWTPGGEYFIRRITFSKDDALFKQLKVAGYTSADLEHDEKSAVILFPIHSKSKRSSSEVPAWEKIHLASEIQAWWSNNAVSCTVDFAPDEAKDIPTLLAMYDGKLKGISFLPQIDGGAYKNMPYEQITKETFEDMCKPLTKADFTVAYHDGVEAAGEKFCSSDVCEVEEEIAGMQSDYVPMIDLASV